jgi:hypothetical protein
VLKLLTQSKAHPHSDRGLDCCSTPAIATEKLLGVERLPHRVWNPCAGLGGIDAVLRKAGHDVIACDLCDYGTPEVAAGLDFLATIYAPRDCSAIVMNPPYRWAQQFAEHALRLVPCVFMLGRLAFLESERRARLFNRGHLVRVHVFRKRLPMMHRHGWNGPRASSAIPFAWFVFNREYRGLPMIDWV